MRLVLEQCYPYESSSCKNLMLSEAVLVELVNLMRTRVRNNGRRDEPSHFMAPATKVDDGACCIPCITAEVAKQPLDVMFVECVSVERMVFSLLASCRMSDSVNNCLGNKSTM